jgi:hypothetical protein
MVGIALVSGFIFMASSAFANPALLKKHDGYPDETGKATTATGGAALEKSMSSGPKGLPDQLKEAGTTQDRTGNTFTDDPRQRKHPGYPDAGVVENHVKGATKVNADPK